MWSSEISSYLGLETKDQWWVKGVVNGVNKSTQEGFTFLLSKAKGFDVYNKYISHSDLVNKFVDFRTWLMTMNTVIYDDNDVWIQHAYRFRILFKL